MDVKKQLDQLLSELNNKNILILGFGKEGQSTYQFIKSHQLDCIIGIADLKSNESIEIIKDIDRDLKLHIGDGYLQSIDQYELIIKSPGIALKKNGIDESKYNITSQATLFMKYFRDVTVGVTGTKGKSTTASLIHHFLKEKYDTYLSGNIGIPFFDIVDNLKDDSIVVAELSSYQCELLNESPHISLFLNIFSDHLLYHSSFELYFDAKRNISRFQNENDIAFYFQDHELLLKEYSKTTYNSQKYSYSIKSHNAYAYSEAGMIYIDGKLLIDDLSQNPLIGEHNLSNIVVASAVAYQFDMTGEQIRDALSTFTPLEHRLQFVTEKQGIKFYNDSISVVPESTIAAMQSFNNVGTVILGGQNEGFDFHELAQYLVNSDIENIILFPDTGNEIAHLMKTLNPNIENDKKLYQTEIMSDAVKFAFKNTMSGKICLLSPASTSFNLFKNFIDKGNQFKEAVYSYIV